MAIIAPPTNTEWKWATTMYVSVSCQSTGKVARKTPVIPPSTNRNRKPHAYNSGVRNSSVPRHSVATQLKTFPPVGTATRYEVSMKKTSTTIGDGVENMWWAHTSSETKPMTTLEAATAL